MGSIIVYFVAMHRVEALMSSVDMYESSVVFRLFTTASVQKKPVRYL